jgi:hypothetical protein
MLHPGVRAVAGMVQQRQVEQLRQELMEPQILGVVAAEGIQKLDLVILQLEDPVW